MNRRSLLKKVGIGLFGFVLEACTRQPTALPTSITGVLTGTTPDGISPATPTPSPVPATNTPGTPTPTPVSKIAKERFTHGFANVIQPQQSLINKGMATGTIRQSKDVSQLTYDVRENKRKPGEQIVFARDPQTKEIILATRTDPVTKEYSWHVAGLRDIADAMGILFGTQIYTPPSYITKGAQAIDAVAARECNLATIADLMWGVTEKDGEGKFTLEKAIAALAMAQREDMVSNGTPLVYGMDAFLYTYMKGYSDKLRLDGLSPAEIKARFTEIIRNHINQLMTTCKGKVAQWCALNEWRGKGSGNPDEEVSKVWGGNDDEFIQFVFQTARQADPSVFLYYNDAYNYLPGDSYYAHTQKIVNMLKSSSLIDGVGLQFHLEGTNPPDKQALVDGLKGYGLPILVTELDVNMVNVSGTFEQKAESQAKIYRTVLEAAIESGVCKSIVTWDFGDAYSWKAGNDPKASMPTLFDTNMKPKPAYFALKDTMTAQVDKE